MKKRVLGLVLVIVVLLIAVVLLNGPGEEADAGLTPTNSNPFTQSDGGGEPRSPGYWALWNTCAEDNRADVAEANGGRAAGWILMDDLLADPGIQVGDLQVTSCEQGLALLAGGGEIASEVDAAVYDLAAQMLAAEINLNLGAESCPVAEEAVLAGHILLADLGFDGQGEYAAQISEETGESISQLVEMLQLYNSGALCVN